MFGKDCLEERNVIFYLFLQDNLRNVAQNVLNLIRLTVQMPSNSI